jgi:hypothetical protein
MHSLLDCGSFPTPSPQYHVSLVAVSSSLPAYSSSSRFGGGSKPLLLRCQAPGAYKLDCSTRLNPILVSASSTQSSRYEGDSREEGLKNSTMASTPFHLAIPVHDIKAAREFFGGVLGCPEGRSAKTWVDFNLFGHQVSLLIPSLFFMKYCTHIPCLQLQEYGLQWHPSMIKLRTSRNLAHTYHACSSRMIL